MCVEQLIKGNMYSNGNTSPHDMAAGVGFSAPEVKLDRLPGWEAHSYGYHGDDGMAFQSNGTGKKYGPVFATGQEHSNSVTGACSLISHSQHGPRHYSITHICCEPSSQSKPRCHLHAAVPRTDLFRAALYCTDSWCLI